MQSQLISTTAGLTADQIDRILNQMADSFGQQLRSPIWHSPSEASWITRMSLFHHWTGCPWKAASFHLAPGSRSPVAGEFSPRSYRGR